MKNCITKLKQHENLGPQEIEAVMQTIMSGKAPERDIEDFLLALREKGPTVEEITGAARIMREFVIRIPTKHEVILDTCGTGGDKKNTFNISTIAALVVAAAGVVVAKHGNRSVSSRCGSADLLEALGINLNLDEEKLSTCLDEISIAFLFAQRLHPAMKNVAPVRKRLGVETIFNVLGPLTNPAMATHQMMGVYNRDLVEPMAYVLQNLGLKKAMVVHGSDGLDEVTTTGVTFVSEFDGKTVSNYTIDPVELKLELAEANDLEGGDLSTNVFLAKEILKGKKCPQRDIVVLNAAGALYISEVVKNFSKGITLANEVIDSGQARKKLEALKEFTNKA